MISVPVEACSKVRSYRSFVRLGLYHLMIIENIDRIVRACSLQDSCLRIIAADSYIHRIFDSVRLIAVFLELFGYSGTEIIEDICWIIFSFLDGIIENIIPDKGQKRAWHAVSCTIYRGDEFLS